MDLWASGLPARVDWPLDVPRVADLDPEPEDMVWRWFALGPGEEIGFHSTPTVDLLTVHSGSVVLILEEGELELQRGDCIVQRGARHCWRNPGPETCVLVGIMAGAAVRD